MDIPTAYGILKQCTGIETDAHTNRLIACMVHEPSPLNLGGQQLLPQYQSPALGQYPNASALLL